MRMLKALAGLLAFGVLSALAEPTSTASDDALPDAVLAGDVVLPIVTTSKSPSIPTRLRFNRPQTR